MLYSYRLLFCKCYWRFSIGESGLSIHTRFSTRTVDLQHVKVCVCGSLSQHCSEKKPLGRVQCPFDTSITTGLKHLSDLCSVTAVNYSTPDELGLNLLRLAMWSDTQVLHLCWCSVFMCTWVCLYIVGGWND